MAKKIDLSGIKRIAQRVAETPKKAEQAVQRARGTLRRRIVPEAKRDIGEEYAIKASRIAAGLSGKPIDGGVELVGSSRGVGLVEFGAKWSRAMPGASAQIHRGGAPKVRPGSFIAAAAGNRHVFKRTGEIRVMKAGRYKGKRREAIGVQYGPSIAQMLRRPGRAEHLGDYAQNILTSEIQRLLG